MADSLTGWLAAKVFSSIESLFPGSDLLKDRESLLEDIPFLKGRKVQILQFFTPLATEEACKQLYGPTEAETSEQGGKGLAAEDTNGGYDRTALWGVVADRFSSVSVRFSQSCVTAFNRTHDRELISLRGTIISLKSFRPSVSLLPSVLDNKEQKSGPFAPRRPVQASLVLDVEGFEVIGSINEVIFWETGNLQRILLDKESSSFSKAFKRWFHKVEKSLIRQRKRMENRRNGVVKKKGKEESSQIVETSQSSDDRSKEVIRGSGSDSTSAPTMLPPPPPYQRPALVAKKREQASPSEQEQHTKKSRYKEAWDNFRLSQDDDDEFGLDAAATDMMEMHERRARNGSGEADLHQEEDDPLLDDIFSLSSGERLLNGYIAEDENSQSNGNQTQSSKGSLSQVTTLPATFPNSSLQAESNEILEPVRSALVLTSPGRLEEQSNAQPPDTSEMTSFPFSLLVDWEDGEEGREMSGDAEERQGIVVKEGVRGEEREVENEKEEEEEEEEELDMPVRPYIPAAPSLLLSEQSAIKTRELTNKSTNTIDQNSSNDRQEKAAQAESQRETSSSPTTLALKRAREDGVSPATITASTGNDPFPEQDQKGWRITVRKLSPEEKEKREKAAIERKKTIVDLAFDD